MIKSVLLGRVQIIGNVCFCRIHLLALTALTYNMRQLKITKQITGRESYSIDKYLQEIGKINVLTPEEEVELAQKAHHGDIEARKRLIICKAISELWIDIR